MALVQTTPAKILKRIRTDDVKAEMELIFDIADGGKSGWQHKDNWYYEESWDKKSFGTVTGKKMITFKSYKVQINNIIKMFARGSHISSKIPRAKKTDEPKFSTSLDKGKAIIYLMVGTQLIKFQETKARGGTSGPSASTKTKMQEIGSAYVFYLALCQDKKWNDWSNLYEDPDIINVLGKGVWKDYAGGQGTTAWEEDGAEWALNFWIQQEALLNKLQCGGNCCLFDSFVHSREAMKYLPSEGSAGTFMEYVQGIVGKMGVTGKDNWNPADIWLIRSGVEKKARESIDSILSSSLPKDNKRLQVNHLMRGYFASKDIFGISLKKVSRHPASVVYFNTQESFFTENWVGKGYGGKGTDDTIMHYSHVTCKLGLDEDNTLETQDTVFVVEDKNEKGAKYKFQIKANNSSEMSGLKYEATAEGHGDARLGKATVEEVIKIIDEHSKYTMDKSKFSYPQNCKQFQDNNLGSPIPGNDGWKKVIDFLWNGRTVYNIDFGSVDSAEECYQNLCLAMSPGPKPHVVNSKLQQLRWLYCFFNLKNFNKDKDRVATKLVWLSMKAGREYGPFAKIY